MLCVCVCVCVCVSPRSRNILMGSLYAFASLIESLIVTRTNLDRPQPLETKSLFSPILPPILHISSLGAREEGEELFLYLLFLSVTPTPADRGRRVRHERKTAARSVRTGDRKRKRAVGQTFVHRRYLQDLLFLLLRPSLPLPSPPPRKGRKTARLSYGPQEREW